MISIVIPVYNTEEYLSQCVDSILRQTYPDWQLILVDDGSTDRSGNICEGYVGKDSRISVIHKQNGGVSSARNVGMAAAKGEYLCFVDADDWLDPDFLSDFQVDKYGADFYISGWHFNVYGKVFSSTRYREAYCCSVPDIRTEFLRQNLKANGYPWGKLYKLSIIRNHGIRFNEKLSINEDHLFVFQYYSLAETLLVTDTAGYQYRVFDNSGRKKLSSLGHSYAEYMEISNSFRGCLARLNERWSFPADFYQDLLRTFVYSSRLRATECSCKNGNKAFAEEVGFWKGQGVKLTTRYESLILTIIRSRTFVPCKRCALMLILFTRSLWRMSRGRDKKVYDYLLSVSQNPQKAADKT